MLTQLTAISSLLVYLMALGACASFPLNAPSSNSDSSAIETVRDSTRAIPQNSKAADAGPSSEDNSSALGETTFDEKVENGPQTVVRYQRQEDLAAEQLLLHAREKLAEGNDVLAQSITERAIRIAPGYVHNYITLARIKLEQEDYVAAGQVAEKGLSLIDGNRWFFESQEERSLRLIAHRVKHQLKQ